MEAGEHVETAVWNEKGARERLGVLVSSPVALIKYSGQNNLWGTSFFQFKATIRHVLEKPGQEEPEAASRERNRGQGMNACSQFLLSFSLGPEARPRWSGPCPCPLR